MTAATIDGAAPLEPPAQRLATEAYVDKRIAELETRLIKWGIGVASVAVAAAKVIPPAY